MTEENKNDSIYQKELFDRLRKSMSLKQEEECIGCIIKPAAWWVIEKPNPKLSDLKKLVSCSCPHYKTTYKNNKKTNCIKLIFDAIHKAREIDLPDVPHRHVSDVTRHVFEFTGVVAVNEGVVDHVFIKLDHQSVSARRWTVSLPFCVEDFIQDAQDFRREFVAQFHQVALA